MIEFLFGEYLQFVLACPPAMWGESSEDTKTASGLAQSRNQALGRMGIIWAVLQKVAARMYYQACLAASNDPDTPEEIIVPVQGAQNVTVRVERLRKGHSWQCRMRIRDFRILPLPKRATFTQFVQMVALFPPAAQPIISAPANWKAMLKFMGLSEMVNPEAEANDKQIEEIEELLMGVPIDPTPEEVEMAQQQHDQQQAIMQQQSALTGMPAPPVQPFDPQSLVRPSVPINPWDFDEWEMQACDDYLNSDAARVELKVGRVNPETQQTEPNVRGIQNVWLHRQEHAKAAAMKAPPVPPAPIVAPKGGGAKKPPGAPPKPESQPAGSPGTATI